MHVRPPGARFLARLLVSRRRGLGLRRAEVVARSRGRGNVPLTPSVLRDLETGDRLPTLARLPALARALALDPGELVAWVELAPLLEETGAAVDPSLARLPGPALLDRARAFLAGGWPAGAAWAASEAWLRGEPAGGAPPVLLARAVLALDRPLLALLLAGRIRPGAETLAVELEALRRLGLERLARRGIPGARAVEGHPTLAAVRARLLEGPDPSAAARAWADLLEDSRRRGDLLLGREASAGIARCRGGREGLGRRGADPGAGAPPGTRGRVARPGAGD